MANVNEQRIQPRSHLHAVNQFHAFLMQQNNVNPNYYNVQFKVIEDTDAQCYTEYTYSYNAGFMQIECSDADAMITGCSSYRPMSEGYRFGEGSKDGMECYTNSQSNGYTRLRYFCLFVYCVCAHRNVCCLSMS